MIKIGIKDLVEEAEANIETMTVDEVMNVKDDDNTILVDIRDIRELWRDGTIPNSIHAPRGMLELCGWTSLCAGGFYSQKNGFRYRGTYGRRIC